MEKRPHVLVLPFPAQGHINPILNFSLQLAAKGGFIVTFVNTHKSHQPMELQFSNLGSAESSGHALDVRFVSIPQASEEPVPGQGSQPFQNHFSSAVPKLIEGMESQQALLEDIVVRSRETPSPITCIVYDCFFARIQAVATKLGIKGVSMWTSNAAIFAISVDIRNGGLQIEDNVVAGLPIPALEVYSVLPLCDSVRLQMAMARLERLREAAFVVINTFQELESPSLEALVAGCETIVRHVGPLFPPGGVSSSAGSLYQPETNACIPWLNQQKPGSVLYVSFGSVVSLSLDQVRELAIGIELTKRPFLWVTRGSAAHLPDGFAERTRGEGLIVNWAPQVEVLGHIAVGGFLSHCGWNSILESIHMGIPMLCYPIYGDQAYSEILVTRLWVLGMGLPKPPGAFTRTEVQSAVDALMSSEELHLRAATWKAASRRAVEAGGSSSSQLDLIIQDLKST